MRYSLLAALATLCLSACASTPPAPPTAADASAAKPTEVAQAAQKEDELVCHDEIPTGTRIPRTVRVCATQEEWDRRREADQKAIRDGARRGGVKTGG